MSTEKNTGGFRLLDLAADRKAREDSECHPAVRAVERFEERAAKATAEGDHELALEMRMASVAIEDGLLWHGLRCGFRNLCGYRTKWSRSNPARILTRDRSR
jgi:hypothetical protein